MKLVFFIFISTFLLIGGNSAIGAEITEDISVIINGEELELSYPPRIKDGRTLVPARPIFVALGARMEWDEDNKIAYGDRGGYRVSLPIGKKDINVDGMMKEIDVAAKVFEGRTYIPLRFSGEAFGAEVKWDSTNRRVVIADNYKEKPKLEQKLKDDKLIELFKQKKYEIEDKFGDYYNSGYFLGAYLIYYENIKFDNPEGLFQSDTLAFHLTTPENEGDILVISSIEAFDNVKVGMNFDEAMEELNWPSVIHHIDHEAEGLSYYYYNYYLDDYRVEMRSETGRKGPIEDIRVIRER